MKTTIIALALFAFCTGGKAQTVTVADVEAIPGETVAFTLDLAGGKANTYTAMQFNAQFPVTGFSTTGKYKVSELWENATATVGEVNAEGVATIPVASSESISAADVEGLLSVYFTVDDDVAIGNYDVTLKNIWFGYGTSSKDYVDDVTFTVHVVNVHSVVLDENSTTDPEAAEGVNVTVKRTISANTWSTICLPFAMSESQVKAAFGDDVELADFDSYEYDETEDVISVKFTDVNAMEANHPYIIKVSQAIEEFAVDGVDVEPTAEPFKGYYTTGKKPKLIGKFAGTYVADFDFYDAADNYPLFLSGNKFYYATENTMHMKAFRGYFDFEDNISDAENASSRIQMVFDESEATGISGVKHESNDDRYYNLNGQRVEYVKKGLYIKNNRKVVVK